MTRQLKWGKNKVEKEFWDEKRQLCEKTSQQTTRSNSCVLAMYTLY